MRSAAWILVTAGPLALAPAASAQQAPPPAPPTADPEVIYPAPRVNLVADLTFTRGPGASVCPEAWLARYMLAARMGTDTFAPDPRGLYVGGVSIALSRTPDGFASSYTWGKRSPPRLPDPRATLEHVRLLA